MRFWAMVLTMVAVAALVGCGEQSGGAAAKQARLDGVTLHDLEGKPERLEPQTGHLTVVNVWATWCAPCRRELPSLERLSKLLDPQRFTVVGVSIDEDLHRVREYLRDKDVTFAKLMDPRAEALGAQLHLPTYPATFILAENGDIVAQVFGERVWHTQDTVQRLERAYAGKGAVF